MIPFALSWFGGGRHGASADWAGSISIWRNRRAANKPRCAWSCDRLVYPSAAGEKAWPPLAMFKVLLLATWYDLSDVALAAALSEQRALLCARARLSMRP